jgi:hypothetical protein
MQNLLANITKFEVNLHKFADKWYSYLENVKSCWLRIDFDLLLDDYLFGGCDFCWNIYHESIRRTRQRHRQQTRTYQMQINWNWNKIGFFSHWLFNIKKLLFWNTNMVSKNFSDGRIFLVNFGRMIICILLLFSILCVSIKTKRVHYTGQILSKDIFISSELTALPEKLCYVWVSTRDVVLRKYNLPCNNRHRYGLDLQISRKISHAAILLLLGGAGYRNESWTKLDASPYSY